MSIIGFICGCIGSIMDFVMIILYVIIVKRFFELLFVNKHLKMKKYCVYYSIIPFAFIHIFSNVFSISEWVYVVYTPQDYKSCLDNVNFFMEVLPYSDYINQVLPNFIALIILYVLNVFGHLPASCCDLE